MEDICTFWIETYKWGTIKKREDIRERGIKSLSEFYLHAISRGINISLNLDEICDNIKNEIPSLEWQYNNLLMFSDKDLVSEEEAQSVYNYRSYGYKNINDRLRMSDLGAKAPINDIIAKMPGLDKDIIVYRFTEWYDYFPTVVGQIFLSKGYLSCTIDVLFATNVVCNELKPGRAPKFDEGAIIKIRIPKGTKAIYIPGNEKELIFAHAINLKLLKYSKEKFVCPSKDKKTCYIVEDMPMFEFQMESS